MNRAQLMFCLREGERLRRDTAEERMRRVEEREDAQRELTDERNSSDDCQIGTDTLLAYLAVPYAAIPMHHYGNNGGQE